MPATAKAKTRGVPYQCRACGHVWRRRQTERFWVVCPACRMRRGAEVDPGMVAPSVHGDDEAGESDLRQYCEDSARITRRNAKGQRTGEVSNAHLSRSLARVPGLPKYIGPDGKQYAVFPTKQAKREQYKRMGLEDGDS